MSLDCRELVEFLMDYVADELAAERRAAFDRHLSGCSPCHTYLRSYEATIRAGKRLFECESAALPPDVPEGLVQAILASRRG